MTNYFDGREYASEKEKMLLEKVTDLKKRGITPKLVSIIVGEDPGSILYQNLKKKAAERVGAELEITSLSSSTSKSDLLEVIQKLNKDAKVHGIMIQLPLPPNFSKDDRTTLIDAIDPGKDVDGLRDDSLFVTPVVKAIIDAIQSQPKDSNVAVVGAHGFEGRKIVAKLKDIGFTKIFEIGHSDENMNSILPEADIVISATGTTDLIKPEMVKEGVVLIDVGSPKGDISKAAYEKASFVSPVPGGIGPATIVNLIENLVNIKYKLTLID